MKLGFFKQDRRKRMQEQSLATLKGLLEASRTDAPPQETLAELMDLGNRELRGENYAARRAAEAASANGPAGADITEAAEPTEDAAVAELSMADLARVLETSHTDEAPQDTLAELMDIGNRQRRGGNRAAKQAAAKKAEEEQAAALLFPVAPAKADSPALAEPTESSEEDTVTELSTAELALLLEASHEADRPSDASRNTGQDI
jgi:hypothetical protein